MHDKLMFVLSRTCGEEMLQEPCNHDNIEDRTWVIEEVRRAVELGYIIQRVSEIWEYKVTQYDPVTKTGGIFSKYIDSFLKINGWPDHCIDEATKKNYIYRFYEKEGILLDINKIKNNSGLCFVAEALLNKVVIANYETFEEAQFPNPTVIRAAYATTGARLKLYEQLHILQRDELYTDTDSLIYLQREGVGPKYYGFIVVNNEGDLTLETLMLDDPTPKYIENPRKIRRTKLFGIVSRPEKKMYRGVYTKRRRDPNTFQTLP
ncbi:hypothetical protein B566_EDAN013227, partial [Ephemera danica]